MTHACLAAAIDWGGTKLMAGLVSNRGEVVAIRETPTPTDSPVSVLDLAESLVAALLDEQGLARDGVVGLGVSLPGLVDAARGVMVFSPARGWRDVAVRDRLRDWWEAPVTVGNDVDNCLLAEWAFGIARGERNVVWIQVSTGVGGSILSDGRPVHGGGGAGEFGHIVVREDGPICGCGNRGCLEATASGPAMARRARAMGLGDIDARVLTELGEAGDPVARDILAKASVDVGRAAAAALNLLDPDLVVLGGGASPALDLDLVRSTALGRSIRVRSTLPRFHRTALGRTVSLVGAAALAFQTKGEIPA